MSGQVNLGRCYATGFGVKKNVVEAYALWKLVEPRNPEVKKLLALVSKEMTPEQIVEGQERAEQLRQVIL